MSRETRITYRCLKSRISTRQVMHCVSDYTRNAWVRLSRLLSGELVSVVLAVFTEAVQIGR